MLGSHHSAVCSLHHAPALGERERAGGPGSEPAEGAERLAVLAAHEQQVLAALARRLGGEAQVDAVVGRDCAQVLGEARGRPDLERHAADPHGPLAVARRVVDAGDEVPGERAAVLGAPDAGAPVATPCGGRGSRRCRRPRRARRARARRRRARPSRAPARRPACASTHTRAPFGQIVSTPSTSSSARSISTPSSTHQHAARAGPAQPHAAARAPRALAQAAGRAIPHGPERLAARPDARVRRRTASAPARRRRRSASASAAATPRHARHAHRRQRQPVEGGGADDAVSARDAPGSGRSRGGLAACAGAVCLLTG